MYLTGLGFMKDNLAGFGKQTKRGMYQAYIRYLEVFRKAGLAVVEELTVLY
jgi:hypothetical protein